MDNEKIMEGNEAVEITTEAEVTNTTSVEEVTVDTTKANAKKMKKNYGGFALAVALFGVGVTLLQLVNVKFLPIVCDKLFGFDLSEVSAFSFLNIIVPMYVVGFPILALALSKMDKVKIEKNKWHFGNYIVSVLLMFGMIGVGITIGLICHLIVISPFGISLENSSDLADLMMNSNPFWRILTVGILAPIVEELIFRKLLIDRVVKYGEWTAILTSGLMFGLFHGNFQQCFFAGLIGGLFAYTYIRTGKIWTTMLLHATLNLMTSVVTVGLMTSVNAEKAAEFTALSQNPDLMNNPALQQQLMEMIPEIGVGVFLMPLWIMTLLGLVIAGIVTWIVVLIMKKIKIQKSENYVKGGMKYAWGNIGMVIFLIYIVATFVLTYVSLILQFKMQ